MPKTQEELSSTTFTKPVPPEVQTAEPRQFAGKLRETILKAGASTSRLRSIIAESLRPQSKSRPPSVDVITDPALKAFLDRYRQIFMDILAQVDLNETQFSERAIETLVTQAIFNQELAADIYHAQNSPQIRDNVEKFIAIIDQLAKIDKKVGLTAQSVLNAARAQAGLTEYFNQQGFQVFYPDPENEDEVVKWDLLGSTDMVAMSKDGKYFIVIDVKSRYYNEDESLGRLDKPKVEVQDAYLGPDLRIKREKRQVEIIKGLRDFLKTQQNMTFDKPQFVLLSLRIELPPSAPYMDTIGTLNSQMKAELTEKLRKIDGSSTIGTYLT